MRDTLKIVELDVLGNRLFHLSAGRKADAVQAFRFQDTNVINVRNCKKIQAEQLPELPQQMGVL